MTQVLRKTTSTYTLNWPVNLVSLFLCFTSFFYSCKDPKRVSLERQALDNPSGIAFTDTFAVKVETVRIDTPSTKNQYHLLLGKFNDDVLGEISSTAYAELSFSGFDTLKLDKITSISLNLQYDFFVGDTANKSLTFDISEVNEKIDSATNYNSTSTIPTNSNPSTPAVLSKSARSVTFTGTALKTRFEGLENLSLGLSEKDFKNQFKGIKLEPTSPSAFVIGFNTNTASGFKLTVTGHKPNTHDTLLTSYDLNITNKSQRFNNVSYDNSKFPPGINAQPLANTNNKGLMNNVLGIRTRISFPGLTSFLKTIKEDYNLMEAFISLPSANGFEQNVNIPYPRISLMECAMDGSILKNADGTYKTVQSEINSSNTPGDLYGSSTPYTLSYDNLGRRFKYPFSLYAKEIQKGGKENNPFIITLSSLYYVDTKSPLSYSYSGNGIKLVVYHSKRPF
jgi:hypothetical protein